MTTHKPGHHGHPVAKATAAATARFVAGLPLDGNRRTDARWSKPGTQATTDTGHASRWAHYSHRKRASVRMLCLMAVVMGVIGLLSDVTSTAQTVRVAVWFLLAIGAWVIMEKSRRYVHRREVIAPLGEVLADRLKDSRYVLDARTWISVPVDVQDRPTRVYLPRTYAPTDTQEKALARLVAGKVGLVNPSHTFELRGEWPFMELRPAPAPRDLVLFSDPEIRAMVEASPEGYPILGLAPRDVPYGLNLDADAPHVGLSMATNAGKSVTGRVALAQHCHRGGIGLVLDRKIVSQAWCDGLPNIRYARSCQEINDALMWTSEEIDRRYAAIQRHSDIHGNVDPALIGPRLMMLVEELNTLEQDLRTWWREVRQPGDPAVCPALAVLARFVAMGRQGRMHMIPISQKLTCQSLGGTAARENLSTRVLGRATTSTWNMLAPECKVGGKYPRMSKVRGRVHVVYANEATPVQVILMEPEEAREYAMSGVVAVFPGNEAGSTTQRVDHRETSGGEVPHPGETQFGEAGGSHLQLVPASGPEVALGAVPEPDLVSLTDAAERLALSIKTLRNARDRDDRFPDPAESGKGKASRYHFEDLELWTMARGEGAGGASA